MTPETKLKQAIEAIKGIKYISDFVQIKQQSEDSDDR